MSQLVIERLIKASPLRVWQALTDKSELSQWLPFLAGFEPKVGAELRFKLGRDAEHQYEHVSRVIEVETGKKLVYGWRYEGYKGDSKVSFELIPEGANQTKVILTHEILEPFPEDNPDFGEGSFKEGWTFTIDGLKDYLEKKRGNKG